MSSARTLKDVRATIKDALGTSTLRSLHDQNAMLDLLGVAAYWGSCVVFFYLLAVLPFGAMWALVFVAQGFAFQCLGLLSHDAFIHRRIWGDCGSWFGAMVSSFPVLLCPTWYLIFHRGHHAHLGTEHDTETYKGNLDSPWKRFLFLTAIGDFLAKKGRLGQSDRPVPAIAVSSIKEGQRLAAERILLTLFVAIVIGASFIWPRYVVFGYVLPLLTVTPLASTLRVILEHADADPENGFHIGTFYRCGPVSRALFVADAGDCHVVHHIFSQIPWYRMQQATRLMRPILLREGVVERRSIAQLLSGWFVRGFPHRSLWFKAEQSTP
jgi:fatty acid desaturase